MTLDAEIPSLLFRLFINLFFTGIIIRAIYYRYSRDTDYMFTYFMISLVVFLLCYSLKKYELDLGLALGLFAVFGIIRYRTDTIHIKEMTYLFVIIGVSIINALANETSGLLEILVSNSVVVTMLFLLERIMKNLNSHLSNTPKEWRCQELVMPLSDKIKPENTEALKKELELLMGVSVKKIIIEKIDLITKSFKIKVYFL
jgi:hypothetical protein